MYTFYYGSMNGAWLKEFYHRAAVVAKDPFVTQSKDFSIGFYRIADHGSEEAVQRLSKRNGWDKECPKFLHNDQYSSYTGDFALVYNKSEVVLQGSGTKILRVLGDFHEDWKKNLPSRGFKSSLVDHYYQLRP